MQLTGEQRIAAPRRRVWDALNDPEILRASIPGCQSLEKEAEGRFAATVELKIGPIGARFKGAVSLADIDPPNGYAIVGEGNAGITGTAKGNAKVALSDDGAGTLLNYTVGAEVSGRLAQLGGPIIEATAKQLAAKFFANFEQIVAGASKPTAPTARAASTATACGAPLSGLPMGWIFAAAVAALAGFLVGAGGADANSPWAGLAIGLLVIVVAGAAFEYGRRAAAPVIMLDSEALRRLLDGGRQ